MNSKEQLISINKKNKDSNELGSSSKRILNSYKYLNGNDKFQSNQNQDNIQILLKENEILHVKNIQLAHQLEILDEGQILQMNRVKDIQIQCKQIEIEIQQVKKVSESEWGLEKKMIQQELKVLDHSLLIWENKIFEVQKSICEEQKNIPVIISKKQDAQNDLRRVRMESQGMKIVITNLQKDIDRLRKESEKAIKSKKKFAPNQQKVMDEIETQGKLIKQRDKTRIEASKNLASSIVFQYLQALFRTRLSSTIITFKKNTDLRFHNRKILFHAINFHKGYIRFIKSKALRNFKNMLELPSEQLRLKKLVQNHLHLRMKGSYFGKWRKEFIKIQFLLIRKLEILTSFQKIEKAFAENLRLNAFNAIKYLRVDKLQGLKIIRSCFQSLKKKIILNVFEKLKKICEIYESQGQVEVSSKYQTQFLIKNLYFNGLALKAKANKGVILSILWKYFRILKKSRTIKRRKALHQVLELILEKHNFNSLLVKSFAAFRYGATVSMEETSKSDKTLITKEMAELKYSTRKYLDNEILNFKVLSLAKMGIIMNKTKKKVFYFWRRWNYIRSKYLNILQMLHAKRYNDMSLGFAMIQNRRFKKLKQSIAEKITSCEFSYNYLTQQNTHIKSVLDKKTLELQKTKFVKIIKRLIDYNRNIMSKYLKRFNKRSQKVWEVRIQTRNLEEIIVRKLKMVFLFEIRCKHQNIHHDIRLTHAVDNSYYKFLMRLKFSGFHGLLFIRERNKRIKRCLNFIQQRNLQIQAHKVFFIIKCRSEQITYQQAHRNFIRDNAKVVQTNKEIEIISQAIVHQKEYLKKRSENYKDRNVIALKIFFVNRIKIYGLKYINRWRKKLAREKRMVKFVSFFEVKFRIKLVEKAFNHLKSFDRMIEIQEFENKLQKFQKDYDQASNQFNQFTNSIQGKMRQMHQQNDKNTINAAMYKKKLQIFDMVKLQRFKKNWQKRFLQYIYRDWRLIKQNTRDKLANMCFRLQIIALRLFFKPFSEIVITKIVYNRIKGNLSRIYHKMYTYNTNYGFQLWKSYANQQNNILKQAHLKDITNILTKGTEKLNLRIKSFQSLWTHPYVHSEMRNSFSTLNRYAKIKKGNKILKSKLEQHLTTSYSLEFIRLLRKSTKKSILLKHQFAKFATIREKKIKGMFIFIVKRDLKRKQMFQKLFLKKYLTNQLFLYKRDALANIKLYQKYKQIYLEDKNTFYAQNLIQILDKIYKRNMGQFVKMWRKNHFIIEMNQNLLRRLTRKCLNKRGQKIFHSWKLQTEARNVVHFHRTEGEVKKREIQFKRAKKYIEDFKKAKGLLLENEEGNLVMSPRVLKKKEAQEKNENSLRYRLISRLLLLSHGDVSSLKAWNNIYLYYLIRQKYKKMAAISLNYMRRPQLFRSFRVWHEVLQEDKERFQNFSREQFIKVLQKHKDKIQIEYSRKINNEESMNREIRRFEILEIQNQRKQKLCGFILIRYVRSKLSSALSKWRQALKDEQSQGGKQLEEQADQKMRSMEKEIQLIQREYQRVINLNNELKRTAIEGLEIAEAVRNLTLQRDELNKEIIQKQLSCEALLQQNINLNNRYNLASQEALQLLSLTKN